MLSCRRLNFLTPCQLGVKFLSSHSTCLNNDRQRESSHHPKRHSSSDVYRRHTKLCTHQHPFGIPSGMVDGQSVHEREDAARCYHYISLQKKTEKRSPPRSSHAVFQSSNSSSSRSSSNAWGVIECENQEDTCLRKLCTLEQCLVHILGYDILSIIYGLQFSVKRIY